MSRGYGNLQCRLLIVLWESERMVADRIRGLDTPTLAQRVYGREPTRSELVSIRRALATLMRDGAVDNFGRRFDHRYRWVRVKQLQKE
jgi:hypothetical protein